MIHACALTVLAREPAAGLLRSPRQRHAHNSSKLLLTVEDLTVADGELLAVVGPNGAGKSTLLGALSGDRALAGGAVRIDGVCLHAQPWSVRAQLRAVLPQRSGLSAAFTAVEVVALASPHVGRAQALQCLDDVGLLTYADRCYPTLSGGEQQRVQFARVLSQLALYPRAALLLDEPTSALDLGQQQIIMRLAKQAAQRGRAVVVVVHDLTLAAQWSDRVVLVAQGRIVRAGATADTLTATQLAAAYGSKFEILQGQRGAVISCISD